MSPDQVLQALNSEIEAAKNYCLQQIGYERAYCYDRYYGRPLGDEIEGQSQVVSQEVAEAIDSAVPQMVEMFVSSDRAVQFTPRNAEDVPLAEQATDLCNYVFYSQNNGYKLVHDAVKDGLLQKTGAFYWYWEPPRFSTEEYKAQTPEAIAILMQDPDMQIVGAEQTEDGRFDVTVKSKQSAGKVCIKAIPPEELLISPRSTELDVYEMPFIGYACLKTRSELMEMGYDKATVDALVPGDDLLATDPTVLSRQQRNNSFGLQTQNVKSDDPANDRFRYYNCYIRLDEDEDGIAELRCICKVGETILYDEEVQHIPISVWTPKIMPHEPIGVSMGDDIADQQVLATVLWRQALDSIYLALKPRMYMDENAKTADTLDDVLNWRCGGVIRGRGPAAVTPIAQPFVGQHAYQMLEYVKQEIESRTGIARYIQGFDPDSLNQTKGGMQILQNNAQIRLKMYARNFAELCLKPLFKGILYLLSCHQQEALTVRLRNQFVPVEPRAWETDYDMTVNVGLGTGAKDQQAQHLTNLMQIQAQVFSSPLGQMIPPPVAYSKVFNAAEKLSELAGFKDVSQFLPNPQELQQPKPQAPPEVQKAQIDAQVKGQVEQARMQANMASQQARLQADTQIEQARMESKMRTDMLKAEYDMRLKMMQQQMDQQTELAIAKIKAQAQIIAADLSATKMANGADDAAEQRYIGNP